MESSTLIDALRKRNPAHDGPLGAAHWSLVDDAVTGQGGFLAMLHPQETVIDHAQGGGAGGAVTVILNISTGVAQTVRAEISNLLPSIIASVQGAVMDARLRGGSTRAAYRG